MRGKRKVVIIYVALTLAAFIAFEQVRRNGFISFDDYQYVTQNPHVNGGISCESVLWAFTSPHCGMWHPLTSLSHMLDCELFGLNPAGHHLANLLLHILNTLLLFSVLKAMTGAVWQSAFVAAVFALHPLNVESVAWIAERKNLLSCLFWLLTIAAYLCYVRRPSVSRYLLTLLVFVMALMSKPVVVTLPLVLLLLDYWPFGRFDFGLNWKKLYRLVLEKVPFLTLSGAVSVVTLVVQQNIGAVVPTGGLPLKIRIANTFVSYLKYIEKMFWPSRLAMFYPHPAGKLSMWQAAASALVLLGISMWVIRLARSHRYLPVGWLWYLVTLLPVIGLVQSGEQAWADHYAYVPLIGMFIIIAWGLDDMSANRRYRKVVLGAAAAIVLAVLLLCTRIQVRYWQDNITLYEHTLTVTENNTGIHYNLGLALWSQGKIDEAISHFYQSIKIFPNSPDVHNSMGLALLEKGKPDGAIMYFTNALKLKPDCLDAQLSLGTALAAQGKFDQAIGHFNKVLEIKPDDARAHYNLGQAYAQQGDFEKAFEHWNQALELQPDSTVFIDNLARMMAIHRNPKFRNPAESLRLALQACEMTGYNEPRFLDTLAAAYAADGKFSQAIETAEKALKLAEAADKKELAGQIRDRLQLYKAGRPYIEK
jgi:tetratricopeptide (TPR) repeat protein